MSNRSDRAVRARALESWRISPVTSLVVGWLMPAVGELMWQLDAADLDPHNGGSCAEAEEWLDDAVGELNSISEHLTRRGVHVRRDDGQFDYCAAIDELQPSAESAESADRLARALHDADCGCGDYDDVEDPRYITAVRTALAACDDKDQP